MSLMASLVTTSRMQQCFNVPIDSNHEFLLLFYCCVLLEIKLTTTYWEAVQPSGWYWPKICMCQSIARWLSKLCDSKYPINSQEDCASLRIQAEIKMAVSLKTTFSHVYSSVQFFAIWFKFHWNLFPSVHLTLRPHCFRWWLGAEQPVSEPMNA